MTLEISSGYGASPQSYQSQKNLLLSTGTMIRMRCGWPLQQANDPKQTAVGKSQSVTTLQANRTLVKMNWRPQVWVGEAAEVWPEHCERLSSSYRKQKVGMLNTFFPHCILLQTVRCLISWSILLTAVINHGILPVRCSFTWQNITWYPRHYWMLVLVCAAKYK